MDSSPLTTLARVMHSLRAKLPASFTEVQGVLMFNRKFVAMAIAFTVVACLFAATSQSAPTDEPKARKATKDGETVSDDDKWMAGKLHGAQEILDGLMHGNSEKVEDHARRMLVLNLLESWVDKNRFSRPSDYEGQLNAFEYSLKELVRTAKAKDTRGSLDSYVRLTRSCVECHQLIRDGDKQETHATPK
jgi:hypothetical protein